MNKMLSTLFKNRLIILVVMTMTSWGTNAQCVVKDFRTIPGLHDKGVGTELKNLISVGGISYFTVKNQLWKSDHSTDGTQMIRTFFSEPENLTQMNGTVYFTANDGTLGTELWKTNGTLAGTEIVRDITEGEEGSDPDNLFADNLNGILYFSANGKLWKTNGSSAGTSMVMQPDGILYPSDFLQVGTDIYFSAYDNTHGTELWRIQGQSPTLFADINPNDSSTPTLLTSDPNSNDFAFAADDGNGYQVWICHDAIVTKYEINTSGDPQLSALCYFNGTLYASATNGASGIELFKLVNNKFELVKDINPVGADAVPHDFTVVGGTLFFTAYGDASKTVRKLWKTNGTTQTTSLVKNTSIPMNSLVAYNNELYFNGDGELWKSNSNGTTTQLVKKINTNGKSNPSHFINADGILLFTADDGIHGTELWKTDGTEAQTKILKDITVKLVEKPTSFITAGEYLFFLFDDGEHGEELWKTDGTTLGTVMVKDINSHDDYNAGSSRISELTEVNGILYFTADDGEHGRELWKSNGTVAETISIKEIDLSDSFTDVKWNLKNLDGTLYFDGANPQKLDSRCIWKSNGTSDGTVPVFPEFTTEASNYAVMNDALYFFAKSNLTGMSRLWKSDGSGNPIIVKQIENGFPANPMNSYEEMVVSGGVLYFPAYDTEEFAMELWRTDGTTNGTYRVKNISPNYGASSFPKLLHDYNGTVLFFANDGTKYGLWKTDGTLNTDATSLISSSPFTQGLLGDSFSHYSLLTVNNLSYFFGTTSTGTRLWRTNGTSAGTFEVSATGFAWDEIDYFIPRVNRNGTLYFSANNLAGQKLLWKSNGTTNGTAIVDLKSINTDELSNLTVFKNNLYFFADDKIVALTTPAQVNLSQTEVSYDGNPKSVVATTVPAGLPVDITYNGSPDAPHAAGDYDIVATINDLSYEGTVTGKLTITKAQPVFSDFTDVIQTFGDAVLKLEAKSDSDGAISYEVKDGGTGQVQLNGNSVTILKAGTVKLIAKVAEGTNHAARASDPITITIDKAQPVFSNFNDLTKTFGAATFKLEAKSDSDGAISYEVMDGGTGQVQLNGNNVTILKAGTVNLIAKVAEGTNHAASASDPITITIHKITPVFSNFNDLTKTFEETPLKLDAASDSDGAISYQVVDGGTGQVQLNGDNVTILKAGTIKLIAKVAEGANQLAGSSDPITLTIKKAQPVFSNFNDLTKTFGNTPFKLEAKSNSNGAISYEILEGGTGQVQLNGSNVTILKAGTVKLMAKVAEGANHVAGTSDPITITIDKALPVFSNISDLTKTFGDEAFKLEAKSNSNGIISYEVIAGGTGQVQLTGNNVTILKAGTVKLRTRLTTDENYAAAFKDVTITINKATQAITFPALADRKNTDQPINLSATSTSKLPVTFKVISGPATIQGNTLTLTQALGTVTIRAEQSGDPNYQPAPPVELSFNVKLDVVAGSGDLLNDVVSIFPIPAHQKVTFESKLSLISAIHVFDLTGKLVESVNLTKGTRSHEMDLSNYAGTFMVKIVTESGLIIKKIVVMP